MTSVHGSLQENAEVNEATLSTLEARLRLFLETDNPRCRPQVAPLRRLALEVTSHFALHVYDASYTDDDLRHDP